MTPADTRGRLCLSPALSTQPVPFIRSSEIKQAALSNAWAIHPRRWRSWAGEEKTVTSIHRSSLGLTPNRPAAEVWGSSRPMAESCVNGHCQSCSHGTTLGPFAFLWDIRVTQRGGEEGHDAGVWGVAAGGTEASQQVLPWTKASAGDWGRLRAEGAWATSQWGRVY